MLQFDFDNPVARLSGNEFLPKPGLTFVQQILEYFQSFDCKAQSPWGEVLLDKKGTIILPLDYYATNGKKQMTGMMAAPIVIGTDSFICVVVVIYNLQEKRLYLHECFLTEKIPEIAASSLVRGSSAASPQSQGSVAKILQKVLNTK